MILQTQCSIIKFKHVALAECVGTGSFACVEDWVEDVHISLVNVNKRKQLMCLHNADSGCPYSLDVSGDYILYVHEMEKIYRLFVVEARTQHVRQYKVGIKEKRPELVQSEDEVDAREWSCTPRVFVSSDGGFVFEAKRTVLVVNAYGIACHTRVSGVVQAVHSSTLITSSKGFLNLFDVETGLCSLSVQHFHQRAIKNARVRGDMLTLYSKDQTTVWRLSTLQQVYVLRLEGVQHFDLQSGVVLTHHWLHAGDDCTYTRAVAMDPHDTVGLPWNWERELWKGNHCSRSLLSRLSRDIINQILSMFSGVTVLDREGHVRSFLSV